MSIGGVDVGGLTVDEAATKIEEALSPQLEGSTVRVFTTQDVYDTYVSTGSTVSDDNGFPGYWTWDASSFGAQIDGEALAHRAYMQTRGDNSFWASLGAWFGKEDLPALVSCDQTSFDSVVSQIDTGVGTAVTNSDLVITDGVVSVSPSANGELVDTSEFISQVSAALLSGTDDESANSFLAPLETVEPTIDETIAQRTATAVQDTISQGLTYTYNDGSWTLSAAQIGTFISTKIELGNDDPQLVAYVNPTLFSSTMTSLLGDLVGAGSVDASFDVSSGSVEITPSSDGTGPDLSTAADNTQDVLFGEATDRTIVMAETVVQPTITTEVAESMGVTELISSFTTQFPVTEAKATNVSVLADILSGTLIAPGETFSFNDTVGDTTTDKGFVTGKVLVDGQMVDGVGGGVCQVASTIFNAAFNLGLQIDERHNHTTHFTNYPEGRDATISYGFYDFKFTNDTDNYILMTMYYTPGSDEGSFTVKLWGTDPQRTVDYQVGAWTEGTKAETVVQEDSNLATGVEEEIQSGVDGGSETVTRQVYNAAGTLIHNDSFFSRYSAMNTIIKKGTGPSTAYKSVAEEEAAEKASSS